VRQNPSRKSYLEKEGPQEYARQEYCGGASYSAKGVFFNGATCTAANVNVTAGVSNTVS
jgi:hypothetical protein